MKRLITVLFVAILALASVIAGVGSIDEECQKHGFDFGIVKFEWKEGSYVKEDSEVSPWSVNVTGDDSSADWVANPAVAGVLHKESNDYYTWSGGTSGAVNEQEHGISHITFCGDDKGNEVPEFSTIAALGVLGLAGAFVLIKRK